MFFFFVFSFIVLSLSHSFFSIGFTLSILESKHCRYSRIDSYFWEWNHSIWSRFFVFVLNWWLGTRHAKMWFTFVPNPFYYEHKLVIFLHSQRKLAVSNKRSLVSVWIRSVDSMQRLIWFFFYLQLNSQQTLSIIQCPSFCIIRLYWSIFVDVSNNLKKMEKSMWNPPNDSTIIFIYENCLQ